MDVALERGMMVAILARLVSEVARDFLALLPASATNTRHSCVASGRHKRAHMNKVKAGFSGLGRLRMELVRNGVIARAFSMVGSQGTQRRGNSRTFADKDNDPRPSFDD